jgi:hypothetical protein
MAPIAAMVMMLPFLVGLIAAIFAIAGWRKASIVAWHALVIVILACFKYHATDALGLSF